MPEPKRGELLPADYNKLVASAELIDVKLIKTDFEVHSEFFAVDPDARSHRYNCEVGKVLVQDDMLLGEIQMLAGCKIGRKWGLRAKATYLVAYVLNGDAPKQAATHYLEKVARFSAYPYFRAHFAALCQGAGAEVPPLPVLRGNVPTKIAPTSEVTSQS
jgi:hypothetical protein